MPTWDKEYYAALRGRFKLMTGGLKSRLKDIVEGRVSPSLENIAIGSAKSMNAAVLFFDIRGSSNRSGIVALYTLDTVVPMMMRIVHDHGGYIEKNTGDGIMAIFTGMNEKKAAENALSVALGLEYIRVLLIRTEAFSRLLDMPRI